MSMLTDKELAALDEELRQGSAFWNRLNDAETLRALIDEVQEWRYYTQPNETKELIEKLRAELSAARDALKLIETWDCYPDLSDFKYYDAFKFLRPKIDEALKRIADSGLLSEANIEESGLLKK